MNNKLSLNPHFNKIPFWKNWITWIEIIDNNWFEKSLLKRIISLFYIANDFDLILFYFEPRLPAVMGILKKIFRLRPRLVLQEYYFDISNYQDIFVRSLIKRRLNLELFYASSSC